MLELKSLSHSFTVNRSSAPAFEKVSFNVDQGEFVTVIGPSGCGKSTLLRVIAGLLPPKSGQIMWNEPAAIGFVFQHFALFPYLTVAENIAFGLRMRGDDSHKIDQQLKELLAEVELDSVADKHPKELSGGMRQRVGIARALAIDPNVLLLDEPFSSLDEFTAENLRQLLLTIWENRKITVIMVTHLIREALELSDRVIVFTPAPGTVELVTENKLERPRDLRSKAFFTLEDKLRVAVKA